MAFSRILLCILFATIVGTTVGNGGFENCENKETEFVYCYGIKDGQNEFGTICLDDDSCHSKIKIELIDTFSDAENWDTIARFTFESNFKVTGGNALVLEFQSSNSIVFKVLCSAENITFWGPEESKPTEMQTKDSTILDGNTCSFNYSKSGKMRTELGFDPFEKEHVITLSTVHCTTPYDFKSVTNRRHLGILDGWSRLFINQGFRYDNCFETDVGLIYPCYPFMFSQRAGGKSCLDDASCDGLFYFVDDETVTVYLNMRMENNKNVYLSAGLSADRFMGGDLVFDCLSTSDSKYAEARVSENLGQKNVPVQHSAYNDVIKGYARVNGKYLECLWELKTIDPLRIVNRKYYLDSIMGRYTILLATGDLDLELNKKKHRLTGIHEQMKFPQYVSSAPLGYYMLLGISIVAVVGVAAQFLYCEWYRIRGKHKSKESNEFAYFPIGESISEAQSKGESKSKSGSKSQSEKHIREENHKYSTKGKHKVANRNKNESRLRLKNKSK